VFGLAVLCGIYLVYIGGWPIVIIGLASILAGIAYTGGPFPLGYNGLGDIFVFVFFGLIAVMGTYYVQAGLPTFAVVLSSLTMGALITNILVVNNVRDTETDKVAGKRTLAVLFGPNAARAEYVVMAVLAYAVPVVLFFSGLASPWVFLPFLSLPLLVGYIRNLYTQTGPILNKTLGGTAQLVAIFAVLFSLGIALP
jgi:1,4-dihydroxy-2-naphthoate octaprenyltransferase